MPSLSERANEVAYRFLVTLDPLTQNILRREAEISGVSMAEVIRRSVRSYAETAEQVRNPRKRTLDA